jgi:DNA-binding transcriptional LysR family regulator
MHAVPWLHAAPVLPVPRDSMGRDLRLPAVYSNPPRPGFRALRRLVLCGTSFRCAQETRCPDHGDYIANAGLCGTRTQAIEARLRRPASPFIGSPLPCLRASSARIGGLSCFGWTHSPPYGKWREAGLLDDITELRTFVNIVGAGSLSAAARQMELALSVVSKRLASLERRAEVRLIARSTRRFALTEEGQDLYERAQRILAEVDDAEAVLTSGRIEPQGLLRVSAPVAFGRAHVGPVCRRLVSAHPRISVDLWLTDRMVDLIEEGVDVVVRIGPPKDSRLVLRKLIDDYRIVVGAPEYLEHRGTPMTPADLDDHDCVHYRGVGTHWRLVGSDGQAVEVRATSRLRSNSGQVALDWALAGCGLVMNSWVDVEAELHTGRLVHVLREWRSDPAPVCALFPSSRQLPSRVRLFIDAMADWLGRRGG